MAHPKPRPLNWIPLTFFLNSFLAIHSQCPILQRLCQHQKFHYLQNLGFNCHLVTVTTYLSISPAHPCPLHFKSPTDLQCTDSATFTIFSLSILHIPFFEECRLHASSNSRISWKKSWILLLCCVFFTLVGSNPSSGHPQQSSFPTLAAEYC